MVLTPLEKSQFFDFSIFFFFFIPERRFFGLEYRKTRFSGLYYILKSYGKMAIFGPKSLVNRFG